MCVFPKQNWLIFKKVSPQIMDSQKTWVPKTINNKYNCFFCNNNSSNSNNINNNSNSPHNIRYTRLLSPDSCSVHWLLLAITKGAEGGKSNYNFIDFLFVIVAFINGKFRPCCRTLFLTKCVMSVSLNFYSKVQRLKHVHRSMLPTRKDSCSASFGQSCRN